MPSALCFTAHPIIVFDGTGGIYLSIAAESGRNGNAAVVSRGRANVDRAAAGLSALHFGSMLGTAANARNFAAVFEYLRQLGASVRHACATRARLPVHYRREHGVSFSTSN